MRNIIEILGLALPGLIILLSVSRIFLKRTMGVNGLIIFSAILLFIIGFLQLVVFKDNSTDEPGNKLPALAVSKHSDAFNRSLENVIDSYTRLTAAFAANDTTGIRIASGLMASALDSFRIDELKVDTLIYETALQPYGNMKAEISAISNDPAMLEKRASYNLFSNEFYTLLRIVRYDLSIFYWLECPSAFGEGRPGNWLSKMETGQNPYAVEDCSETRSTINFIKTDSTTTADSTNH